MRLLIFIVISLFSQDIKAQVLSNTYNVMLKTLLSHSVPEVSVTEALKMNHVIFLDARENNEFKVSRLPNSIFVGYDNFKIDAVSDLNKDQKIVVYCSVGYRSEKIAEQLKKAGFTNVSNLYGGIFEWVNQGKPVYDSLGNETANVHAYNKTWGIWLDKGNKIYD
jgi:rhodanese-related sulfurtransferase